MVCCRLASPPIASRPTKNREERMDRRAFLAGSAVAALVTPSFAQDYPSRPVTLVNPFPPGGAVDVVGLPFAAALEPLLKHPVAVETKSGAVRPGVTRSVPSGSHASFTRLSPL